MCFLTNHHPVLKRVRKTSVDELKEERAIVRDLIPS